MMSQPLLAMQGFPCLYGLQQCRCQQVGLGWKGFCTASLTTAMAVVMAELVRQVEVQCSERAQAIGLVWNMYTAAVDSCMSESQPRTLALLASMHDADIS